MRESKSPPIFGSSKPPGKMEKGRHRCYEINLDFFFQTLFCRNMVQVSSEYISIGCNRTAHAASWGNNGLVAFGADTLIALYAPLVKP